MADQVVSLLSAILSWGVPRDYADANPCREIKKLSDSDGYAPWGWADIEHAREQLPAHLWHAVAAALYSGQRQSDVLQMTWNRIVDGGIEVRQGKTGKRLWLPLHRDLRTIFDTVPRRGPQILTVNRHAILTPDRRASLTPYIDGCSSAVAVAAERSDAA